MNKVIGIDVSKATFDVSWQENGKYKPAVFANESKGFKCFLKTLKSGDHCVMEASGPYYLSLAMFLHSKNILVSVVNPLSVRRFCQMHLVRAKTDKKDATMIAKYGEMVHPELWKPEGEHIMQMRDILTTLEGYEKQITALNNQLEAEKHLPVRSKKAFNSKERIIRLIQKEIDLLNSELESIAEENCKETLDNLQTIPGIGIKTSVTLIILTNNFQHFDDAKKLSAYIGLSPRIYQSGSSVKGKNHICKMGNARARKMLYLCTWTAQKCNPQCKELKERLEQKGKPIRVIKIAMANKLLRMAFAVAKKNVAYDKNIGLETCF
jgi:transposase